MVICDIRPCVAITVPLKPPSRTRVLLPRPSHNSFSSTGNVAINDASADNDSACIYCLAIPPVRQLVCRDMGSFFRILHLSITLSSDLVITFITTKLPYLPALFLAVMQCVQYCLHPWLKPGHRPVKLTAGQFPGFQHLQ